MKRPFLNRRGLGMSLAFILMVLLVPGILLIQKNLIYQSRMSVKDKNLKTAREFAGAYLADMMRTFAADYNRDHLSPDLLNRLPLSWANQGGAQEVTAERLVDRPSKILRITSRGQFSRHGTKSPGSTDKGINALFHFRSDMTRFEMVLDNGTPPDPFGIPTDTFSLDSFDPNVRAGGFINKNIWVNGHLDATNSNTRFRQGVLVVEGNFIANSATLGPNLLVYCRNYFPAGVTLNPPVTILAYPATSPQTGVAATPLNNPFVPKIEVTNPGANGRLNYYNSHWSVRINSNNPLIINFVPGMAQVTELGVTTNYPLPNPATLVTVGADVTLQGVIDRSLTVVVNTDNGGLGGNVTVLDNLVYGDMSNTANANQGLAVLAARDIFFNTNMDSNQVVDGLYYSLAGNIDVSNSHFSLRVNGTLYGRVRNWPPIDPSLTFVVQADPNLYRFYPPNLPKRPYVATWDYVP